MISISREETGIGDDYREEKMFRQNELTEGFKRASRPLAFQAGSQSLNLLNMVLPVHEVKFPPFAPGEGTEDRVVQQLYFSAIRLFTALNRFVHGRDLGND